MQLPLAGIAAQPRWQGRGPQRIAPLTTVRAALRQVHNNEKKDCPWWNIFCVEEARPQRAKWVATAMDKKMDCGGCADGKPPNYQPYEPSALPPRDPGPVFPDDTPTGTTGDSTEDTGTDGSADSSGDCSAVTQSNVFLELTGAGEDRYQPADDWGACCALCQEDSVCMAWCVHGRGRAGEGGGDLRWRRRCRQRQPCPPACSAACSGQLCAPTHGVR